MLLLSDRYPTAERPMVHALLATSAVHHHLSKLRLIDKHGREFVGRRDRDQCVCSHHSIE